MRPTDVIRLEKYALMSTKINEEPYVVVDFQSLDGFVLDSDLIEVPGYINPGTYTIQFGLENIETLDKANYTLAVTVVEEGQILIQQQSQFADQNKTNENKLPYFRNRIIPLLRSSFRQGSGVEGVIELG